MLGGGDVLIAVGETFGLGDEDVATPALNRGGDVFIALRNVCGKATRTSLPRPW
jgi:hypothetical protein